MTSEPMISCPNCKHEFKLTESLAAPLIEKMRSSYERRILEKESEVSKRETALRSKEDNLEKTRARLEDEIAARLSAQIEKVAAEESRKAKALAASDLEAKNRELSDLREILEDRNSKLSEAQKLQAEAVRKQRELDDAKREMELTIEKRVQELLSSVREKAKLEAEDLLKIRITEREEQIASMTRQIEELKRKAEQGSQQLQGEAQEIQLENILRSNFPADSVEPVPKGEFGGDVIQGVIAANNILCGSILWETKRTRNWSDGWLAKLRADQRGIKADFAILVSQALPKGISTFGFIDGIWVTDSQCAMPLAISLRHSLIELAGARTANEGQKEKMAFVYQYLTGPNFKHRIEAIVEKFVDMQSDLDKERRSTMRLWAKREAQIKGVLDSTAGLWGD